MKSTILPESKDLLGYSIHTTVVHTRWPTESYARAAGSPMQDVRRARTWQTKPVQLHMVIN